MDQFLGPQIRRRRGLLPLPLDAPQVVWLEVGERLNPETERVLLRVRISDLAARRTVAVALNGAPLAIVGPSTAPQPDATPWRYAGWFPTGELPGWIELAVDPRLVRHGWNALSIAAAGSRTGGLSVQDLELVVTPRAQVDESDS